MPAHKGERGRKRKRGRRRRRGRGINRGGIEGFREGNEGERTRESDNGSHYEVCPRKKETVYLSPQQSVAMVLRPGCMDAVHKAAEHVVQHKDGCLGVCTLLQNRLTHL